MVAAEIMPRSATTQARPIIADRIEETIALARKLLKDSGYSANDIDRIVLIGGPSKMPFIRDRVPRDLGIPSDVSTDPMIAVAIGAAIFAESRDWSGETSTRKGARASVAAQGTPEVRFDHPARTSDDAVVVRLRVAGVAEGHTVQIDAPTGWTSGRVDVRDGTAIKVPVGDHGENGFRAALFDASGRPLGTTILRIIRTYASAAGIPATQTLAVKVRDSAGGSRNVLDPLITKGTLLPTAGSKEFVAAHDLEPTVHGSIELEEFQDEGTPEPDLNLAVGSFRVSNDDLPEGAKVRKGDKVVFHWRMDDSALLNGSVELPSVGQISETRRFYVDQVGHRSFDGEAGARLAASVLDLTRQEINGVRQAVGDPAKQDVERLEQRLSRQQQVLETAATADERRAVTEEGRHIRQEISRLRNRPEHRGKILEVPLAELRKQYDDFARDVADASANIRFDELSETCRGELERRSGRWLETVDAALSEMRAIYNRNLWKNSGFVVYLFKSLAEDRHMASDKTAFDRLVQDGTKAMNENNIDQLRGVVFSLFEVQIQVGGDTAIDRLASIYRG
jgi:molecular chaperone DnaK